MDGRFFAGRRLHAEHWDGITDYQVEETDLEREERLQKWNSFLEVRELTKLIPTENSTCLVNAGE